MNAESTIVLGLNAVRKEYGRNLALANINLRLRSGEIFVLLGLNGSGKSTLLKVVATLLPLDGGRVSFFDENGTVKDQTRVREGMGVLFDHTAHWDRLTGYENAWFFIRSYGIPPEKARTTLDALFKQLGMWDKRNESVATYSYGMRRKLGVIEAVAHQPNILLLDEPSMGLDYTSRLSLYELLRDVAHKGTTVLVATNDVNEAVTLATRVALIDRGRIAVTGVPEALVASLNALTRIDLSLAMPHDTTSLIGIEEVESIVADDEEGASKLQLLVRTQPETLTRIVQRVTEEGGVIQHLDIREPDLGDVFLKFTGRARDSDAP